MNAILNKENTENFVYLFQNKNNRQLLAASPGWNLKRISISCLGGGNQTRPFIAIWKNVEVQMMD